MLTQSQISNICNAIARSTGYRPSETVVERDYVLAWFLSQVGESPLSKQVAFKGGTALRRCWLPDYRFSEDLDFTLTWDSSLADLQAGFEAVFDRVLAAVGISLAR